MKSFLTLLFFVFMTMTAFADIGHVNSSVSLDSKGALQAGSLDKYYINVKNNGSFTASLGSVMVLATSSDDGYTVDVSTTPYDRPHCVMAEACAASALCSCQTYGFTDSADFDSTNANATGGEAGYISENFAGSIQANGLVNVDASDRPVGIFYDSLTASDTTVDFFIDLR